PARRFFPPDFVTAEALVLPRVLPRVRDGPRRGRRLPPGTSPSWEASWLAGAGRCAPYHHRDGDRVAPEAADSALDPARHAAAASAADLVRGGSGPSRRLPLPRRSTDCATAQPDRPCGHEVLDTPRTGGRNRLSTLCGARCGGEHRARIGDRRSDEIILTSSRFLLYGRP